MPVIDLDDSSSGQPPLLEWATANGLDPNAMGYPIVVDTDQKRVTYIHIARRPDDPPGYPQGERSEVTVSYETEFPYKEA